MVACHAPGDEGQQEQLADHAGQDSFVAEHDQAEILALQRQSEVEHQDGENRQYDKQTVHSFGVI